MHEFVALFLFFQVVNIKGRLQSVKEKERYLQSLLGRRLGPNEQPAGQFQRTSWTYQMSLYNPTCKTTRPIKAGMP